MTQKNNVDTLRERIAHVAHRLLDRLESEIAPGREHPLNPAAQCLARGKCNLLALWRWCDQAGCRRARRCLGAPHPCLRRHAWLVPPDIAAGVETLLAGVRKNRGLRPLPPRLRRELARLVDWRAANGGG
jgi:hypothetical protein